MLPGDDVLFVDPAECPGIHVVADALQRPVVGIVAAIGEVYPRRLLGRIEKGDFLRRDRQQFVLVGHQDVPAGIRPLAGNHFIQLLDIREYLRPAELPVFFQCAFHLVDGERFEQIVHGVDPEGMDGVLVVGGREDHGRLDGRPLEYLESRTVGQMDVHENQIRGGVLFQPCDALHDTLRRARYPDVRGRFREDAPQVVEGPHFVFYDQYPHLVCFMFILTIGRKTRNTPSPPPSAFSMRISLPSSSLYLLLRLVSPMPFDSGGVSFG